MNNLKILHITPDFNYNSGRSKSVFLTLKYLKKYNNSVFLATNKGDFVKNIKELEIPFLQISINKRNPFSFFNDLSVLKKFVKENNIDIVHSHHRYTDLLAKRLEKDSKIKAVTTVHNIVYDKKILSYKISNIIAVSNSIKEHLINYYKKSPDSISVIYNFVEPEKRDLLSGKKELSEKYKINNKFLIGYAGRLNYKEKGVDVLLESFKIFNNKYPETALMLIGDGDDKNIALEFVQSNNLPVIFINTVENISNYLDLLDVFVLPSRFEACPNVILEAGIMKKPVIASNAGGIPEIIKDKINGLLFEKDRPKELSEKLEMLYNNIELRKKLAENLYSEIKNNFNADKTISELINYYNNLFTSV